MSYEDILPPEWRKEKRYAEQEMTDMLTGGTAILVHRWEDFKDGYDIHVAKENNPLYDYLVKYELALLSIGFVGADSCFSLQTLVKSRDDLEKFVQITEYEKVLSNETELVYKYVKGKFIDNFEIMELTNRRTYDFPTS